MTATDYRAFLFLTEGFDPEILVAFLCEWPFESFHEEQELVTAYIPANAVTEDLVNYLDELAGQCFGSYSMEVVPDVNWNAQWEASFDPVPVEQDYYIRAAFHDRPEAGAYRHEILISPRMAFGTGHHATTYMMLRAIAGLPVKGMDVLDFGCGTGILAVAAALEGARSVTGNDIQPEAIENAQEHAHLNGVADVCRFLEGGIEQIEAMKADLMLANINTWVIRESAEAILGCLRPGGFLLLSGILERDAEAIRELFESRGLVLNSQAHRDEWVQLTLQLPE